jgi:hypothetical protein
MTETPSAKREESANDIERWLVCPNCGSEDTGWQMTNGRLHLFCEAEPCLFSTSRLIGKHHFRRSKRVETDRHEGGDHAE